MSCATGTLVRMAEGSVERVENLFEGAELLGLPDKEPVCVTQPLQFAMRPCVMVRTDGGQELVCETDQALLLFGGGYVGADESLDRYVRTRGRAVQVIEVKKVGPRRVVRFEVNRSHVYEANGLFTEE
jgi:hypothetical protein